MAPNHTTPSVVRSGRRNSRQSRRRISRKAFTSTNEIAALISTAPSAAIGAYCSGPVKSIEDECDRSRRDQAR